MKNNFLSRHKPQVLIHHNSILSWVAFTQGEGSVPYNRCQIQLLPGDKNKFSYLL